jgi:hypothetical protein
MKNLTLHFASLEEMSQFVKQLYGGYLLNTMNNTITSCFPEYYLNLAINQYKATIVDTSINQNPYNKNILVAA